jgi:predicted metal-dependent hydrolase
MNRAIRNRLVDLLLGGFASDAKRDALRWLDFYCERGGAGDRADQSLDDLQAAWQDRYPDAAVGPDIVRDVLGSLEGIFEIVRCDGRTEKHMAVPVGPSAAGVRIRLCREIVPYSTAVCDKIRMYLHVLEQVGGQRTTLERIRPLHRAVAEAAICFNSGLFFEAHEHLEHQWARQDDSPTKLLLQGIIQVSVGFHHAMRGSYEGAVNQLRKGLAKLAEAPADALGLDRDRFVREVRAARENIVTRGRQAMRPAALDELPRMHLLR